MRLLECFDMIFFDIITLAVIGWMIFRGKNDGLVAQVFALAGIAIGVALSIIYGAEVGNLLNLDSQYAEIVGFLIILITAVVIALFISKFVSKTIEFIKLGWLNSILGVLFSVVKGVAILSLIYAAIFSLNERLKVVEPTEFDKSISFNVVRKLADPLIKYWEDTKPIEKIEQLQKPEA